MLVFLLLGVLAVILVRLSWRLLGIAARAFGRVIKRADLPERISGRLRRGGQGLPDPFETLRLQARLSVVAELARRTESDPAVFARAERLLATLRAYDLLLDDACLLAGVEPREGNPRDPQERFRKEVELASRGWSW